MSKKNPAIPTQVREAIHRRDRHWCLRCGGGGKHLHHRMRRREGGHGLWNIVTLCDGCHRWVHANVTRAREEGYIIPTYTPDPDGVPLRTYWDWIVLDPAGSHARTTAPPAAYLQPHA